MAADNPTPLSERNFFTSGLQDCRNFAGRKSKTSWAQTQVTLSLTSIDTRREELIVWSVDSVGLSIKEPDLSSVIARH